MNGIRKSLTLLVVIAFTSQAIIPELARAVVTAPATTQAVDIDDTEEEEEEEASPVQTSQFTHLDPTYIVPVVVATFIIVATLRHFLRNNGGVAPVAGAALAALPQANIGGDRLPPTPFAGAGHTPAADHGMGSNVLNADSAVLAGSANKVLTPGVTPVQRRSVASAKRQEEEGVASVATAPVSTRSTKKVAWGSAFKTPDAPPSSSRKQRVDTPMPPRTQETAPAPLDAVAVVAATINQVDVEPMDVDQGAGTLDRAPTLLDMDEEEDVQRARKGKKKGAATAVKRGRRNADREACEAAAPLTACLGKKRARRTGVNYQENE